MTESSTSHTESLSKVQRKAERVARDPQRLSRLLDASREKLGQVNVSQETVQGFAGAVKAFIRMIRAYRNGEYQAIPWKTLLLMVAALIYFVSPIDLIPDFIPITGFVDDISVVLYIFNRLRKDLEAFQEWERSATTPAE